MLAGDRLLLRPDYSRMRGFPGWSEIVLYREGCYQVGLVVFRPGVTVPRHRHLRCDSVDLALAGPDSRFEIDGHWGPRPMRGSLAANLVPVPAGVWHGGTTGPEGACYLTFQRWQGEPGYITEDWEPWELQPASR